MKHAVALIFAALATVTACGTDDPTPGGMSGMEDAKNFVGAYRTTITIAGTSSQTYTDSLSIAAGTTSDLILQSQQLGALKATVIGPTAFSLDQQQITLTDATGRAFSVTLQGQGTVSSGVFDANGQMSSSNGAVSFTMAGSRL